MQSFEFSFSCLLPPQSLFPPSVEVTNHGLLKHQQPQPDIKSATDGILDKCYETPGSRDFPFCYSTVVNYWTVYKTRVTSPFSIIWMLSISSLLEKKRSINDILFHTYYASGMMQSPLIPLSPHHPHHHFGNRVFFRPLYREKNQRHNGLSQSLTSLI